MAGPAHSSLAAGRWQTLSLVEQLGNIGSEVARAVSWQRRGETEHREKALERALELLDLTIADPRWRRRLHEITRAREIICDVFYGDNAYGVSLKELEKYFLAFACAARAGH